MNLAVIKNHVYPIIVLITLISIALVSLFASFQDVMVRTYLAPIRGVLSTDSYESYPYSKNNLEIGFSQYGEFITPQKMSYAENGQLMGRGLSYDGYEALACPDDQNRYYPVEGWLLQYSYFDRSQNDNEQGIAYALYSDLDDRLPEAGRTQNLLAEPIETICNTARRFVAEVNIHVLESSLHDIINLKQTIVYNKASKYVTIIMDVVFLESPERAGPLHLNISRRANFKLAHSLTLTQGKPDQAYVDLQRSVKTPYKYHSWPGHIHDGYYDLMKIYAKSLLTGGPEYTGFVAFWPNVTDNRLYGWDEWNKTIEGNELPLNESKPVFVTGEWDAVVEPEASKRFVVIYGITDGNSNGEVQLQIDRVFNPWALRNATSSSTKYQWVFVGRDAPLEDFTSANLIMQEIPVQEGFLLGFDRFNPNSSEVPFLIQTLKGNEDQLGYYDSLGRLHLNENWTDHEIAGSAMIVLGGTAANFGTTYFNDYMDVFPIDGCIYAPGFWVNHSVELYSEAVGYAVIGVCQDPDKTSALVVWGITVEDTSYAALYMNFILDRLETMPSGITAVILKFNYAYAPDALGFLESVRWLGTIIEFREEP